MSAKDPVHPKAAKVRAEVERLRARIESKRSEVLQARAAVIRLEDLIRGLEASLRRCPGCTHEPHYPDPCGATCLARKRKPDRPCACDAWVCSDSFCTRMRSYGIGDRPNGCFGSQKHEGRPTLDPPCPGPSVPS